MASHHKIIIFGILLNFLSQVKCQNSIKLTAIECWAKPGVGVNSTCSIKDMGHTQALDMEGWLIKPVNNLYGSLELYRKVNGNYKPFVLNATANVCKILEGTSSSFYGAFVLKWIKENSKTNVIRKCPAYGHFYIKDLVPIPNHIPMIIPNGEYRCDLFFYDGPRSEESVFFKSITHASFTNGPTE